MVYSEEVTGVLLGKGERGASMAYDEHLATRVRKILVGQTGVIEKKMFGGLAFMIRGNMCCGVNAGDLMVRVGPDAYEEALARPHVREMDFTGRPLRGMVYVGPTGCKSDDVLRGWVERGVSFSAALPNKRVKRRVAGASRQFRRK